MTYSVGGKRLIDYLQDTVRAANPFHCFCDHSYFLHVRDHPRDPGKKETECGRSGGLAPPGFAFVFVGTIIDPSGAGAFADLFDLVSVAMVVSPGVVIANAVGRA